MIPAAFDYVRATSIEDALAKLGATGGAGRLVAGGHSLVPLMKLRMSEPGVLIDIGHIPGLSGIHVRGDAIEIGAATVHHDIATSPLLHRACPMLADTAAVIGDPQVRNRGTLGGSLAHGDPAADYPAAMVALDADIHIRGPQGSRTVKASAFFRDVFTVDLRPEEIIVGVQFSPVQASAYAKLPQRASHFAIVGVAAALDVRAGVIHSARVGVTGASSHATRLTEVERALAGQPASTPSIEAAARGAGATLQDVNADIHASAEYRRAMVAVFAERALARALERVG
jgi:carbon-monoxide dehydrogenase medium subunit